MKKTILICEDDEGIIDVATIVLLQNGYHVESTTMGSKVMGMIKQNKPNLILLDLWMPEMNGEEVVTILKSHKETMDIPIIIVSASKDIKKIATDTHVTAFLSKPFDITDLEDIVKKYVN